MEKDASRPAPEDGRYMSAVKLGPKGQIVIPKEVRDMFGVGPGDSLLLLADVRRGIALQTFTYFDNLADAIFEGKGGEVLPEEKEEDLQSFARALGQLRGEPDEDRS